ncbi:stage III sporulation protein AE [Fredinandcohnia sp. 179-A 10B2 NHS]|uniref:stage III sporulation protein AE n=1 Tax=Fredinandcohnia sp. 179-A 10B2 NHS TaxID=3235176 RepID=UPI0039A30948
MTRTKVLSFLILLFALLFFSLPQFVQASPPTQEVIDDQIQEQVEEQIENLGIEDITKFWDEIVTEYGGYLPESQKGSLLDFISGEKELSLKEWMLGLVKYVFHELIANGKLLSTLIMLTIFSMFLQTLQNSFEKSAVSKVAYSLVYMVLIIIALNSFRVAISYTEEAIQTMINFILALVPLLLALVASSGGIASAAFFHPLILFLMNTSGLLIQYVVLPLLFMSALLSIVSTLSEQYKVTQLAQLLRNISIGIIGTFLTIFLGVISVQGTTTAVADGITIRTAKFITGNFVPVIGRMFTDATDTVISASVILKNTVGILGVAILLLIAAFPAIKVLSLAIIYKMAAALLQPLGGGPVIACLDIISKSVVYIFAALAIVSLMFFLSITVIIAAGNLTLMVR